MSDIIVNERYFMGADEAGARAYGYGHAKGFHAHSLIRYRGRINLAAVQRMVRAAREANGDPLNMAEGEGEGT